MKKIFYLLFISTILMVSCSKKENVKPENVIASFSYNYDRSKDSLVGYSTLHVSFPIKDKYDNIYSSITTTWEDNSKPVHLGFIIFTAPPYGLTNDIFLLYGNDSIYGKELKSNLNLANFIYDCFSPLINQTRL